MRSAAPNATRSFVAGPNQRKVEVRIQTSPATPVDPTNWVAEAWVDGRLLVADLTPDLRGKARAVNRVLNWGIVVVFLLILAATSYRWVL